MMIISRAIHLGTAEMIKNKKTTTIMTSLNKSLTLTMLDGSKYDIFLQMGNLKVQGNISRQWA
jgi:hypothetical protein